MTGSRNVSMAARVHALLWGVFSLGGFIAAFFLPVLIYVNSIAFPLGLWPATSMDPTNLLVSQRLSALFVFLTIAGSLYHGMFRFTSTLAELGLGRVKGRVAAFGYAVVGAGIVMLLLYLVALNPSLLRLF